MRGSWIWAKKSIFQANFRKISIFSSNLNFSDFPAKNCPFTATSRQLILFLFKSHHFRTNVLYVIRYNNISRPVFDPHDPSNDHLPKVCGGRDLPTPRD